MALLSDIDWVILVAAAAFLLFGRGSSDVMRTMGRWYGRAARLKQELLSEFTQAADLPVGGGPGGLSFRGALLGLDAPAAHASGIPAAVTSPPVPPVARLSPDASIPWTGGYPTPVWTTTVPSGPADAEVRP
jgi:hypothetical protein